MITITRTLTVYDAYANYPESGYGGGSVAGWLELQT